jgi:hypothetical protein
MIEFMQSVDEATDSETADVAEPGQHLFQLSLAAAALAQPTTKSMQLLVQIQGKPYRFLIDSGSSSCFLDSSCANDL